MIRIVFGAVTGVLIGCGLVLLGSALLPFAREFAAFEVDRASLLPRMLRLVGGVFCLGASRWTLQLSLRPRE
jgi:hypothetical protein